MYINLILSKPCTKDVNQAISCLLNSNKRTHELILSDPMNPCTVEFDIIGVNFGDDVSLLVLLK